MDGAWAYLILVPFFYAGMSVARRRRGAPSAEQEYLGRCLACSCPGLGAPKVVEDG